MGTAVWYMHACMHACMHVCDSPGDAVARNPPASIGDAGDIGLSPGPERAPGVGNGNPLQYPCMGNSINRGAWRATVHGVPRSWTGLRMHPHTGMYAWMVALRIAV